MSDSLEPKLKQKILNIDKKVELENHRSRNFCSENLRKNWICYRVNLSGSQSTRKISCCRKKITCYCTAQIVSNISSKRSIERR